MAVSLFIQLRLDIGQGTIESGVGNVRDKFDRRFQSRITIVLHR